MFCRLWFRVLFSLKCSCVLFVFDCAVMYGVFMFGVLFLFAAYV